jgi:hypothetical protein
MWYVIHGNFIVYTPGVFARVKPDLAWKRKSTFRKFQLSTVWYSSVGKAFDYWAEGWGIESQPVSPTFVAGMYLIHGYIYTKCAVSCLSVYCTQYISSVRFVFLRSFSQLLACTLGMFLHTNCRDYLNRAGVGGGGKFVDVNVSSVAYWW